MSTIITSPITVSSGNTYTIETGSTFTVPGGTAAIIVSGNGVLDTAADASDILFTANGGGAIVNSGTATVSGSTFCENKSGGGGSAIVNNGTGAVLTLDSSYFKDNSSVGDGGALYVGNGTTCTDTNSVYEGNKVTGGYGGGAVEVRYATYTATSCTYMGNESGPGNAGGAINVDGEFGSVVATTACLFRNNQSTASGGAIYADGKTLSVTECQFIGNTSGKGGAIADFNTLTVTDCFFQNNVSTNGTTGDTRGGGALFSAEEPATVTGSTFTGNTATTGGAIYNVYKITVEDSVFTGNIASNAGGAIWNSGTATVTDSVFETASDSVYNGSVLTFFGTNTLNSTLSGNGLSYSGAEGTVLKGTGSVEQTYIAQGNTTTLDGMSLKSTLIGGKVNEGLDQTTPNSIDLFFNSVSMTSDTKVYGAGKTNADITVGDVNLSFSGSAMGTKALVCAGGATDGAKITAGTVTTTSTVASGDMGILYGGANLTNGGSFKATEVNTTISGNAHWLSFVGNGSRGGNNSSGVTTDIEESILNIEGGIFDKLVYAGAFAAGDAVQVGDTELNISGGTFNAMVFGGNGGNTQVNSAKSTVSGNVEVTVTVGSSDILFNHSLMAGSYGTGVIEGTTTVTFQGNNTSGKLDFADGAYVSGGSQKAWHSADRIETYVKGGVMDGSKRDVDSRFLVFDNYTGGFDANMSNGFSNIEFKNGATVQFAGAGTEVDLRYTKVWTFDVSDSAIDLTWTAGQNDFDGDTINLLDWNGENQTFMTGSNATLKGFDKASVVVAGFSSEEYKVMRDGNSLKIIAVGA